MPQFFSTNLLLLPLDEKYSTLSKTVYAFLSPNLFDRLQSYVTFVFHILLDGFEPTFCTIAFFSL